MMPDFVGFAIEAGKAGYTTEECSHCGGWVWVPPPHKRTAEAVASGRFWCSTRRCEAAEGAARKANAYRDIKP